MANRYLELIEKRARQELEDLNQAQQRAIIEAYNSAGKQLVRSYRGARDGTATKALLASYTQKIAEETQQIIEQYAIKGAQIAPSVEKLIMQEAFKMAGLDTSLANDKFDNIIGKLGMESVKNVIGGKIYKDGAGLSARIWQASATSSNKIQEIITAGLAQDMGAAKLSKLLQDYVNPTARKTWDNKKIREILGGSYARWNSNLEYNALRLARTTLAHTATMSMRQAQKINPYATKIMWHSVHAAGRTCSICEEMDGQVYDTDKCPFDHPNGMCYQTHEFDKSLDEIADELAAWCRGEENEMLDEWWERTTGEKPSYGIKENLLHRLITRAELKKMSEAHPYNHTLSFDELFQKVQKGEISMDEASNLLNASKSQYDFIYRGYVKTTQSWEINEYLRNLPTGEAVTKWNDIINTLDSAIDSYQFKDNVKLRRFVARDYLSGTFGGETIDSISTHIGSIFENKQYLSTTIDSNPCFDNRPAIMTILCDKGTSAFPTVNYDEGEIILGRNTRYELIDVIDHRGDNPMSLEYESDGRTRNFNYRGIELVVKMLK